MTGIIITNPPTVELPPGNNNNNPASLPGVTYLSAFLGLPQTWTAAQTYLPDTFQLAGSSIGALTLNAPATASGTITFPPGNTDFSATGGASKVVKQTTLGGPFTVGQLAYSDISGVPALVKGDVGLGNVDNTSDANKPVSTAQAAAIALKAPLASPSFTGTATFSDPSGQGPLLVGNGATTPSKRVRAFDGNFQVVNDANTQVILDLTDAGVLTLNASPNAPTPIAGDNSTKLATTAFVGAAKPNILGWAASGVPTNTEFSGGQISTQGVSGNSLSLYAWPTAVATSTVFSAAADYTSLSGSGTVPVASFGCTTGATHTAHVRVNSTFLEDYSTAATQPVALFACARKHGGNASQFVFASNIQVIDSSTSTGAIIGMEIDVDGNATTQSSLGLGIYARGSGFNGNNAVLLTADPGATWGNGIKVSGPFVLAGLDTVSMTTTPYAVHMANNQRLAWDGGTPGTVRSWIVFNQAAAQFQFFIDGAMIGHIP